MRNGVFSDITPCGSFKNRHFGGTLLLLHEGDNNRELGTTLPVTSNGRTLRRNSQRASVASYSVVPSSPIIVTLMKERLSSSETSVLARATWFSIPEDTILLILKLFHRIASKVEFLTSGYMPAVPRFEPVIS
jgi:hypothetical protein